MNDKKEIVENLIEILGIEYKNLLQPIMKTRDTCINEIIKNVNKLMPLIINDEYNLALFLLEKSEVLLIANNENNITKLIDTLQYEMKPKLLDYFNTLL